MFKSNAADAFIASVLAAAALLVLNQQGYVFTWDSNLFLIFSDMFAQGYLDRESSYAPLTIWSLGSLRLILSDFHLSINTYFFLTWFAFFFLVNKAATGTLLPGVLAFLVIFGNSVTLVQFSFVLSEPAYSVMLAVTLVSLLEITLGGADAQSDRATKKLRGWELAFLVALAMLPLQRYAGGFAAIILGAAYLVRMPSFQRLRRLVIAALPFLFILFWNVRATGHLSGYRDASQTSFSENFSQLGETIFGEFRFGLGIFVLVVALLTALWLHVDKGKGWKTKLSSGATLLLIIIALPMQHISQVYSSSVFDLDPISTRFVIIVVPAIYATFIWAVSKWMDQYNSRRDYIPYFVWIAAIVALLPTMTHFEWEMGEDLNTNRVYPTGSGFLNRAGPGPAAIIAGNTKHMLAADILLNRISGDGACEHYETRGSFLDDAFHFAANCDAHLPDLYPVVLNQWSDLDAQFKIALIAQTELSSDSSQTLLDSIPECASIETLEHLTLVDLRPCDKIAPPQSGLLQAL